LIYVITTFAFPRYAITIRDIRNLPLQFTQMFKYAIECLYVLLQQIWPNVSLSSSSCTLLPLSSQNRSLNYARRHMTLMPPLRRRTRGPLMRSTSGRQHRHRTLVSHSEGLIRRPEGGIEWEPTKILLQRENSTYAPNLQPRIPTRVCQGHVVTTDLPTLGTNPKQSQSGGTNQEAKDLATLCSTRRTVREPTADRPRGSGGPSENDSQTSNTALTITDLPWRHLGPSAINTLVADCPRTPCGPSAKPPATEDGWKSGSKGRHSRTSDEHEEHQSSCLHADRPRPIGGLSTRHKQNSPNSKSRGQPLLPVHGSPKRPELSRKYLGKI
jgi:hypothetical protein